MLAQEEESISELQEGTKISECFLSHVTLKCLLKGGLSTHVPVPDGDKVRTSSSPKLHKDYMQKNGEIG